MIKKILLWLWLAFLSFINFNNAWNVQLIWLSSYPSIYDNNYDITFLKWWWFITNYLWYWKNVVALESKVLFWWAENWQPYLYSPIWQWFFDRYYSCDELTGLDSVPTNCTSLFMTWDFKWIFKGFFSSVNAWDFVYYNYDNVSFSTSQCWYRKKQFQMCFSSSNYHKSICFAVVPASCYYWCQWWAWYCNNVFWWNFVNSQNLWSNTDFTSISSNWFSYAPWQAWYDWSSNIDWWSQNVINSAITWNVTYSTCTNSKALSYYKIQWYNDKLCYSSYWNNTDIYSSPWSVSDYSLTWLDISEVWLDTAWYRRYWNTWSALPYNDWFQYWRKSFEVYNGSYNSSWTISNPFVWVPVSLFTLFWNVYSYWLAYNNQSIIEYCDLLLFTNPNNPYEWILWDLPCNYSAIDILADTIWVHADSWEVVKWSSWEWILNRPWYHLDLWRNSWSVSSWNSSWLSYFWDWKSFINNSFNLLSDSFRFPDRDSRWIIPSYILVFMFALILFRFISH